MRLFCAIGWHRAVPHDRWNRGYYFSRCRSCGCDLVRTSAGRWHIPKGYRVVWKDKPAAAPDEVRQVPERQKSEHLEQARSASIPPPIVPAVAPADAFSEVRAERTLPAETRKQALPQGDMPVEQALPRPDTGNAPETVRPRANAAPSVEQARQPIPESGDDFWIEGQDGNPVGMAPAGPSEGPAKPISPLFDPWDDFMKDGADGDAWSSPPPVPALPDFEDDFMADRDDAIPDRPFEPVAARAPDHAPPAPDTVDPDDKVKKARRGRKKAAES